MKNKVLGLLVLTACSALGVVSCGVKYSKDNVSSTTVLPPKYLTAKGWQKCLQTNSISGSKSLCMPKNKPEKCNEETFSALANDHIKACTQGASVLPPAYLNHKGWQQCLLLENKGTWRELCMPRKKINSCDQKVWDGLESDNAILPPRCPANATPIKSKTIAEPRSRVST